MTLKKIYIVLFLGLLAQTGFAQAKLTATVSKNKLSINQRLKIEFSINKQGADSFTPPNFKNFRVVGGPSQSVSQSWINGKVSFLQSYTYILQPQKKGELVIGTASIIIGKKIIKSNPIKIIVLKAIKLPKNPNDPNYIAQQNVHLVAEISKSNPFVGEGIYVEYKLYVSQNISVHNYSVTESPQYNSFWNQDINIKGLQVKMGKYNGEKYRYVVLKKALLIPTKSGKLKIEPMKMDIIIGVPTGRGDFFGNAITKNVQMAFASPTKIIRVKELPLKGKPNNFNGAVGEFLYTVTSNKNILKANESSQIKITIDGKGNLKLFEIPKIETPKELEVYTPEREEKVRTTLNGLRGSVSDTYTVVPQFKGKYKIPGTSFSYFNPKEEQYHTITTEDLFVSVLEGKEIPHSNTVTKQVIATTGKNFRYIQTKSNFQPLKKVDFFKSTWFYLLLFLPLISIPIGVIIAKKNEEKDKDIVGNKQRKADKLAKKYLSEANKKLGNKESFYEALERALHNYLKAKFSIETADISSQKITILLQEKKIDNTVINQFIAVLKDCDFARYTPTTNVQMKEEYEKAKQIITQLDKQL